MQNGHCKLFWDVLKPSMVSIGIKTVISTRTIGNSMVSGANCTSPKQDDNYPVIMNAQTFGRFII